MHYLAPLLRLIKRIVFDYLLLPHSITVQSFINLITNLDPKKKSHYQFWTKWISYTWSRGSRCWHTLRSVNNLQRARVTQAVTSSLLSLRRPSTNTRPRTSLQLAAVSVSEENGRFCRTCLKKSPLVSSLSILN